MPITASGVDMIQSSKRSDHCLRWVVDDAQCRIGGYRLLVQERRVAETVDVIDDEIESTNGEAIELVSTADIGVGSGYRNSNKPAVFGQAVRNDRHGAEQRTLFIACNDLQAGQHQIGRAACRERVYQEGEN